MSSSLQSKRLGEEEGGNDTRSLSPSKSHESATVPTDVSQSQETPNSINRPRFVGNEKGSRRDLIGSSQAAPKVRGSRWADEVDEDDQFLPIKPSFPTRERNHQMKESSTRGAPVLTRRPTPMASKPESRGIERRTGKPLPPVRERKSEVQSRPSGPSAKELEEISHMKEIMTKKAEERKRLKIEEEERIEMERKARCAAKLREIEERQKSRTDSKATTPEINEKPKRNISPKTPSKEPVMRPVESPSEVDQKRQAFNQARYSVRQEREDSRRKEGMDTNLLVQPQHPLPPQSMSVHAQEFVPMPHHPQMMHPHQWVPHQMPPPFGYPDHPPQYPGYYPYPPQHFAGYMQGPPGPYY